jgi:membrane associated rhomboid family serine protease
MLIPYSTDAPIYHWPITTVLLIAVIVLAFCGEVANPDQVSAFILAFGDGLHPLQWLTCNFMHADFFHIAGNMVFLWCFGLIVEGKLG